MSSTCWQLLAVLGWAFMHALLGFRSGLPRTCVFWSAPFGAALLTAPRLRARSGTRWKLLCGAVASSDASIWQLALSPPAVTACS